MKGEKWEKKKPQRGKEMGWWLVTQRKKQLINGKTKEKRDEKG